MSRTLLRKARGTVAIARRLPGQGRAAFRPEERVRAARDERLRRLARHAAATVPFYRGLDPRAIRTAEDLTHVPVLEKQLLQEDVTRFRSTAVPDAETVRLSTAGSTGTPVVVPRDRPSLYAMVAHTERERSVEARLAGARYRYSVVQIVNPRGNVARVLDALGSSSWRPLRPRLHNASIGAQPDEVAETLTRVRPAVVRGYGTFLDLLFAARAAGEVSFPLPRVALFSGDGMSPEGRASAEELGVPVLARYSACEAIRIGYFCELRTGYHLHEDLCHVEVVDAEGRPLPPGELGEVVVTDLTNRATVLLRIRLGDLARIAPEPCSCGRTSRLLVDLDGRVSQVIHLADGAAVHPIMVEGAIRRVGDRVLRFQVVQERRDAFLVRIIVPDEEAFRRTETAATPVLRERLHGAEVRWERHAELAPEESGKYRSFVLLAPG